jgi:hypothetical protein
MLTFGSCAKRGLATMVLPRMPEADHRDLLAVLLGETLEDCLLRERIKPGLDEVHMALMDSLVIAPRPNLSPGKLMESVAKPRLFSLERCSWMCLFANPTAAWVTGLTVAMTILGRRPLESWRW